MTGEQSAAAFLADVTAGVRRMQGFGVNLADSPVNALPVGGGVGQLIPVARVGVSPLGHMVVLLGSEEGRHGLILPPSLGGDADLWGRGLKL